MMKVCVLGLVMLILVLILQSGTTSGTPLCASPPLSRAQRVQIVTAAQQAIHRFVHLDPKERRGDQIPRRFWGAAIARLQPVRVVNDRMNVMIVLGEDVKQEHGLYVSVPISSYAPGYDGRFAVFEKLSQPQDKVLGVLYRYRLRTAKPEASARREAPSPAARW